MEHLRSAAATRATLCEKPAFLIMCCISSTSEVRGSQGLGDTSSQEVESAGSKPLEAREVPPREEPTGPQTTPSEAIVEL